MKRMCLSTMWFAAWFSLVGCGSSSNSKAPAKDSDATGSGGTIKIGQLVEFEGEAATIADAPSPFTHGAQTSYQLAVDTKTTVQLDETMASTGCFEGSQAAGPFVTLHRTEADKLTTDDRKFPSLAVTGSDFSTTLDEGNYNVVVDFYATSNECGAMLSFRFKAVTEPNTDGIVEGGIDNDNSNGGTGNSGSNEENDGDSDDDADTGESDDGDHDGFELDPALIGSWRYTESDEFFQLVHSFDVSDTGTVTQKFVVNDDLYVDEDLTLTMLSPTTPSRFEMTVSNIRVNETDDPGAVGDKYRCIYEVSSVAPKSLKINCVEGEQDFPTDWIDAVLFLQSEDAQPPLPPSGDVVFRELLDLSYPIPDNNTIGITQPIDIVENVVIHDVVVSVAITHTYIGDLRVSIIHPDGTEVILHDQSDGSAVNLNKTYGKNGSQPVGDLGRFNGKMSAGDWQLKVSDHAGSDVGILRGVTLAIHH